MTDAPASSSAPTTWTPDGEVPAPAPKISEAALVDAVSQVFDPEIPVNVYELGLIYAFDIAESGHVKVEMTLTAPNCPSAQELPAQVKDVVSAVAGVTSCDVEVVWDPPWDPSRMSEEARLQLNMY
jgi:FeS assembly SUF system protein